MFGFGMVKAIAAKRKNFGNLFSGSFSEFGKKFIMILKVFLFIYLIPAIVLGLLFISVVFVSFPEVSGEVFSNLVSSGFSGFDFSSSGLFTPWLVVIFVFFFIVVILLMVLLNVSYVYIAISEKEMLFKEIFRVARKFFWKYLWLGIVTIFLLILLFILLIVPGVIFLVYWLFASIILLKEKTTVWESLKKSKQTVKGRWWRVFGYFILIMLIAIVVSSVGSLIPIIGGFVSTLVVSPFITIFLKNFYLDLKRSGE